ncbi:MAG: AIR synthase, partial [Firmicutes bacterium]|nr:AIR synthase [Bacillota bacterium]
EDKIPVSDVTKKICNHFGINYLRLISSGCMMIIVHPDREQAVVEAIRAVGVDVTRIGHVKEHGASRVLIGNDGVVREIDPPESDEQYKVVK